MDTYRLAVDFPSAAPSWATDLLAELAREVDREMNGDATERVNSLRTRIVQHVSEQEQLSLHCALLLSVTCDLVLQGWRVEINGSRILISQPVALRDTALEKARVKRAHSIERDRQLSEPSNRAFIRQMEESRLYGGAWVSIFTLMRDGAELSNALRDVRDKSADALRSVVDPYVQIIAGDETCEYTGLRLADIWRYFRMTWSSAYQSTPGRRMYVLIRDRAAPYHPVMGIAALSSAVVQLSVRDEWIGWTPESTVSRLTKYGSEDDARHLLNTLRKALEGIYVKDFLEEGLLLADEMVSPRVATVRRLSGEARRARVAHEENPETRANDAWSADPNAADWSAVAVTPLFRSKRAAALSDLLQTILDLKEAGFVEATSAHLRGALQSPVGRKAIARIMRAVKGQHVGIDLLDITTCGAIAPYGPLLGGKLVSLLMMSPEVSAHYNRRYADSVSLIASGMAGELIKRPPQLVYLGTTSLYGVGSSQYNRLRVPPSAVQGASGELSFIEIGKTVGFGSFHFSDLSMDLGDKLTRHRIERRRVNSIFGEGVNPRLRKFREALTHIDLPPEKVMQHGSPRLVYAVPLASNFREVLTGRATKAEYLLSFQDPKNGTEALVDYWRRRWLARRIERDEVLREVAVHTLERPVRHGARVMISEGTADLPLFRESLS